MSFLSCYRRDTYSTVSTKPITIFETYEPMAATILSACSATLSVASKLFMNSNPWAIAFMTAASLPACIHGPKVYTNWIPKLAKMSKGEIIRSITNIPNVSRGLNGWQNNSTHSHHFDEGIAQGLIELCGEETFHSHADFDCGGKGEYSSALRDGGILDTTSFDFSSASVGLSLKTMYPLQLMVLPDFEPPKQYQLVTSFEAMSKTMGSELDLFITHLISATESGGMIAISCAVPGQSGPNSNCRTNEEIIDQFKGKGCTFNSEATIKLRRLANPMHIWFKQSLLVFNKE